jgi:hypothetical protein
VAAWHDMNIDTYVLGLPGLDGYGAKVLDELAVTGGTGEFITPDNPTAIQRRLTEIVQQTTSVGFESCTIHLRPAALLDELHLTVRKGGSEMELPRVDDNGEQAWAVSADGTTVELLGETCAAAKSGAYSQLRFDLGCIAPSKQRAR